MYGVLGSLSPPLIPLVVICLLFYGWGLYALGRASASKQLGVQSAIALAQQSDREGSSPEGQGDVNGKALLSLTSDEPQVYKDSDFEGTWWTSQKAWDLERRAIFSKVCSALSSVYEVI
jgi:hypothetical protein